MKPISPNFFTSSQTTRCCNTGHPVLADPLTGRTICSCQLQSGVPAYLSRVPSLPETVYSQASPKLSTGSIVGDRSGSAFFPTYPTENQMHRVSMASPTVPSYYMDHVMSSHPYGAMYPGFDINGARRKNTNRESTGPLKAWLYQHRKNPYPTKGEKVMLAIISQMTLTQVSTWFANARRRLKKESKIDDKDIDLSDIDVDDSSLRNMSSSSILTDSDSESATNYLNISKSHSELSDISDGEEQSPRDHNSRKTCTQRLFSPDGRVDQCLDRNSSPETTSPTYFSKNESVPLNDITENEKPEKELTNTNKDSVEDIQTTTSNCTAKTTTLTADKIQNKPKIWSIAEMLR